MLPKMKEDEPTCSSTLTTQGFKAGSRQLYQWFHMGRVLFGTLTPSVPLDCTYGARLNHVVSGIVFLQRVFSK